MNLIEQAERLKTLPDQELVQMQQRPTMIAPFLVLAEMQRRETMRKAATSGQDPVQQTTVAQEMSSRLAQMQPQQQPQQTQQMRTGGAVRAANGLPDDVAKFFDYTGAASIPEPPTAGMTRAPGLSRITSPMPAFDLSEIEALAGPARGTGAILSDIRGVRGESPLVALGEQLKQREEQVRGQRQSLGETLMRLGLGMAASRRPDFLGAVGEGGLSALQGYVQNRDFTRKEAADLLRQRMAVEAQRQQSDDVLFREAGDLARAEQYGRVSTMQAIQAARNTALTANTAAEREEARNRANALIAQFNADQKRAEEASQREFQSGESQKDRISREKIAGMRVTSTTGGGGGERSGEEFKALSNLQKSIGDSVDNLKKIDDMLMTERDPNRVKQLTAARDQVQANATALVNQFTVLRQAMGIGQSNLVPSNEDLLRGMGDQAPAASLVNPPRSQPMQGESGLQKFVNKYFSGMSDAARLDPRAITGSIPTFPAPPPRVETDLDRRIKSSPLGGLFTDPRSIR